MKYLFLLLLSFNAFAGFTVNNQLLGTATTSSVKILPSLSNRSYLYIQNTGAASCSVKFGSAHVGNEGVTIPAGGNYEPREVPADSIYIKTVSGTVTYQITEGKK